MRNLLIGLVIVIVLAVVLLRGDQLVELVETIKKGSVIPLVAALCTQLGKYFAQSFAYSFAFEAVGERMDPRSTLPLVFGTFFMNTIAPSLNLAGTTLVVDDARRRGIPPGRATSAALLMQITVDSGFATIMLVGFAILAFTVGLSPLWFLLGLLVIALVTVMVLILVLGRKRPALVLRALRPIERLVDRIRVRFKKPPLDSWVERTVGSFSDAAGLIAHNPKATAKAFGCSVVASLCELACFSLVGVGFGVTVPEALICGHAVRHDIDHPTGRGRGRGCRGGGVHVVRRVERGGPVHCARVPRHRVLVPVLGGRHPHPDHEVLQAGGEEDRAHRPQVRPHAHRRRTGQAPGRGEGAGRARLGQGTARRPLAAGAGRWRAARFLRAARPLTVRGALYVFQPQKLRQSRVYAMRGFAML